MEAILIITGFIFIVLILAAIGLASFFMFLVDICGSDSSRDL